MAGAMRNETAVKPGFPLSSTEINGFASRSVALGSILSVGELALIVGAYEREDKQATDAWRWFSGVAVRLNRSVLATAVIGALILTVGLLQPWLEKEAPSSAQIIPWVLTVLGFAGLLIGGYAAACLYELNAGDLAGDWMRTRARAEQLRSKYFDRLVARATAADIATQGAVLDLVNTHLLEHQLNYFGERGKRHERTAVKWLRWAAFASGVAAVGVAAGGMAGATDKSWMLAIAAFGGIGSAIVAFAATQETIGQEKERAQRFRNNVDALELLAGRIDEVHGAIAAGSSDVLVTFTSAINQQLALELGQFLQGGDSIRVSITKLGQQIDESRKAKKEGDAGPPAVPTA